MNDNYEYAKILSEVIDKSDLEAEMKNQLNELINCLMKNKYKMFPMISETDDCEILIDSLNCCQLAKIENWKESIEEKWHSLENDFGHYEEKEQMLYSILNEEELIVQKWFDDLITTDEFLKIIKEKIE